MGLEARRTDISANKLFAVGQAVFLRYNQNLRCFLAMKDVPTRRLQLALSDPGNGFPAEVPLMHRKPGLSFANVSTINPASPVAAALVLAGLSAFNSGCGNSDPVTVYESVPVTRTLDPAMTAAPREPRFRMIAAINDQPNATWFIKMTGTIAQVAAAEIKWQEFLATTRFENGDPKWNLP